LGRHLPSPLIASPGGGQVGLNSTGLISCVACALARCGNGLRQSGKLFFSPDGGSAPPLASKYRALARNSSPPKGTRARAPAPPKQSRKRRTGASDPHRFYPPSRWRRVGSPPVIRRRSSAVVGGQASLRDAVSRGVWVPASELAGYCHWSLRDPGSSGLLLFLYFDRSLQTTDPSYPLGVAARRLRVARDDSG
jgi:hypothetical protein